MENKTKLTPELMYDMGFWKGSYTNIWYHSEYGKIDDFIPCGIYIDDCYRPRYRDILGETVFCCTYKEDLIEEFNITL
ncbi:hypothetical protein J6O48_13860 [bacterium]|nr:hypothetical protein [bacterium]